jgi:hypothetical protein
MTGLAPSTEDSTIFTISMVRLIVSIVSTKGFHENTTGTMEETEYNVKFWSTRQCRSTEEWLLTDFSHIKETGQNDDRYGEMTRHSCINDPDAPYLHEGEKMAGIKRMSAH